jgi:cyclophilin family peptidyl-prolyl cis-trans isomerase
MRPNIARRIAAVKRLACAAVVLACWTVQAHAWAGPTGTLVQFNFSGRDPVEVDLFDQLTPLTVANFLQNYVNPGNYNNTWIHSSLQVATTGVGAIQGGAVYNNTNTLSLVPAASPINLEYSRANTAGTLAMWRTSPNAPNSATSIWSFNAVDNSGPLGPGGNSTNGYAAFGWIVGPGLSVITDINNLFAPNLSGLGSPLFSSFPQTSTSSFSPVVLDSIQVLKTHAAFQNPYMSVDVNNSGTLTPQDLDIVLEDIALHGIHAVSGPFSGLNYLDVTGDGLVSPADVLAIVDAFNQLVAPVAQPAGLGVPSVGSLAVVPEPSSLVLACVALLGGWAFCRTGRRTRSAVAR